MDTAFSDMTLLDWFASNVLKGWAVTMANHEFTDEHRARIAKNCYEMAQSMLKARKEVRGQCGNG